MSEDKRKNARTQGRYSDGDKESRQSSKMSFTDKNKGDKRKSPNVGSRVQKDMDLQFDEKSKVSFKELEAPKKPQELRFNGPVMKMSESHNGISRVLYFPDFMKLAEADEYMETLRNTTKWHDKNIVIKGVEYPQPRLVAWYGPYPYTYAGATLEAREMPVTIRKIKEMVEASLRRNGINVELNSVLLNWYRNEKDSVAWHSDDELSLGVSPTIASVSLGETRRFEMRPKDHMKDMDPYDISYVNLTHGSLIIMDGSMQQDWLHRVPKEYHARADRINLTFRTIHAIDQRSPSGMPRLTNNKSVKSPSEKIVQQQDLSLDPESFPPLGLEISDKKTRSSKENGNKDYQQSTSQRKSPKGYFGASDTKSKFSPKENRRKGNQQSAAEEKYKKEENWDDEMFHDSEEASPIQNNLNKKRSLNDNSNGETPKSFNMNFPSGVIKSERYLGNSETHWVRNYETKDNSLPEPKNQGSFDKEPVDFNSNVKVPANLVRKPFTSNDIKSEFQFDNSKTYQSCNQESTHNQFLESEDPSLYENTPVEIKPEPVKNGGKKYSLNADAPDFVPQNRFERYSLSDFAEHCKNVRNEDLQSFTDSLIICIHKNESHFFPRDWYELEVYERLTEDSSLNNEHWQIILERIGSMIKNAFYKKSDGHRYDTRYRNSNRSYDDNSYRKPKQSYSRSQRF